MSFILNDKLVQAIGWAASLAAVAMYVAYIDQIRLNLAGHPGSPLQPAVAVFNCLLWTAYGAGRAKKDWPIILANVPGIVLGSVAVMTAL